MTNYLTFNKLRQEDDKSVVTKGKKREGYLFCPGGAAPDGFWFSFVNACP